MFAVPGHGTVAITICCSAGSERTGCVCAPGHMQVYLKLGSGSDPATSRGQGDDSTDPGYLHPGMLWGGHCSGQAAACSTRRVYVYALRIAPEPVVTLLWRSSSVAVGTSSIGRLTGFGSWPSSSPQIIRHIWNLPQSCTSSISSILTEEAASQRLRRHIGAPSTWDLEAAAKACPARHPFTLPRC